MLLGLLRSRGVGRRLRPDRGHAARPPRGRASAAGQRPRPDCWTRRPADERRRRHGRRHRASVPRVARVPVAASPRCDGSVGGSRCGTTRCCSSLAVALDRLPGPDQGIFLTPRNLTLLALQSSITALAAISAVMLIVTRNFDSRSARRWRSSASSPPSADRRSWASTRSSRSGVAMVVGIGAGGVERLWVTRVGVPSFIVTLAGLLYFRGISMILTNGATVSPVPPVDDGASRSTPSARALPSHRGRRRVPRRVSRRSASRPPGARRRSG